MDMSLHPLVQSFHAAEALDPYFNMPVCDPSQSGWGKATDLFADEHNNLKEMVMNYGHERWGTTNNHVAASAFIIAYLTRFVYPAMFGLGPGIEHNTHKIGECVDTRELAPVMAFYARFPSLHRERTTA